MKKLLTGKKKFKINYYNIISYNNSIEYYSDTEILEKKV